MTKQEAMARRVLTLDDLRELEVEMLTPALAARFLRCDPYYLNLCARQAPERLGFPSLVTGRTGTRVKFPRLGLIAWAEGLNKNAAVGENAPLRQQEDEYTDRISGKGSVFHP